MSSLRDSYIHLSLPGTPVPGYRLYRPCGTAGAEEAAESGTEREDISSVAKAVKLVGHLPYG